MSEWKITVLTNRNYEVFQDGINRGVRFFADKSLIMDYMISQYGVTPDDSVIVDGMVFQVAAIKAPEPAIVAQQQQTAFEKTLNPMEASGSLKEIMMMGVLIVLAYLFFRKVK